MQGRLHVEQYRGDHCGGDGGHRFARGRERAEHVGQQRGDRRGRAQAAAAAHPLAVGNRADQRQAEQAGGERRGAESRPENTCPAAQHADQGVGAQAGHPAAIGLLAALPAALETDDQADRQRRGQPAHGGIECQRRGRGHAHGSIASRYSGTLHGQR